MPSNRKLLNVVELYAGTGRSVEPFRRWKRAKIALLVDSSAVARKTYLKNFPKAPYLKRSLLQMRPREVVAEAGGRIDILLGCPPCQGFSESGRRDPEDKRNSHMSRFADVIEAATPKAVALENVPMASSSSEYQKLVDVLDKLEYRWVSMLANAIQYGSCQNRQRLIVLALHKKIGAEPKLKRPTHGNNERVFSYATRTYKSVALNKIELLGVAPATQHLARTLAVDWTSTLGPRPTQTVWDCIGDLADLDDAQALDLHHSAWAHSASVLRRMGQIAEGAQWSGSKDYYSQSYGRLHRRGFARTITGNFPYAGCGRFWHPVDNRSLTLREGARIQGFPDSFRFLTQNKDAALLVGNALDSRLASICYEAIRPAFD